MFIPKKTQRAPFPIVFYEYRYGIFIILYELLPTVTRALFWTLTLTAYFYYTMFTNHSKIYIKIFLDKPTCTLPNIQP